MSRQNTITHFTQGKGIKSVPLMLLLLISFFLSVKVQAQVNSIGVDMSLIDGIELNAENIFNYRIDNRTDNPQQVEVVGRVYYRRSGLNFNYRYNTTIQPGQNHMSRNSIPTPTWIFSENALRELFLTYNKLPQGTYEYCITVTPKKPGAEQPDVNEPSACAYQTVEDIFLINLVTPENDAKIYEYNPMLAWVVNYPFASELTYKLRVAELKEGQNPQNAVTRNNPMYKDDHVMTTGTVYPVTAKPLQKWQPYVWTVDAYYKGILLGGAEVWKFTIVDDSEMVAVSKDQSYYEFENHIGDTRLYAVGEVKLKYISDLNADTLSVTILKNDGEPANSKAFTFPMRLGDNRIIFEIYDKVNLKHKEKYSLKIIRGDKKEYTVPFTYINPLLIK